MLTKNEILNGNEFHIGTCKRIIGKRGGVKVNIQTCRRNGTTQLWKTRPDDFRIPIKIGFRGYGEITPHNVEMFHSTLNCQIGEN